MDSTLYWKTITHYKKRVFSVFHFFFIFIYLNAKTHRKRPLWRNRKKKKHQKMCILSVFILVTYRNGKVCAKVLHIVQQLFSLKGFLESFQRFGCWWLWHPIWGKKTRFQESVLGTKRIYRVESTLYGNRPFMGYLSMFFFQLLKCQIAETLAKSP